MIMCSDPDNANFINFCSGSETTNGIQNEQGSCNGIPMGKIPAKNRMVSAILTNPKHNDNLEEKQTFTIQLSVKDLQAGVFVNPTTQYYTAPQDVNGQGQIIGHVHVTIQDIGDLNTPNIPDPSTFAFFKGIDDAGDGNGNLQTTVEGGLPAGVYRVCTLTAAANHQPVIMPVAQ